jgi:hypothetical protein
MRVGLVEGVLVEGRIVASWSAGGAGCARACLVEIELAVVDHIESKVIDCL